MAAYPDDNPKTMFGAQKISIFKIPPSALAYCAAAMMDGARKYDPYNWREKRVTASIYLDAAMRHIAAFIDGEERAVDSNVPHLGHAMASLAILIDALETGNCNDDRPMPGAFVGVAEKLKKWLADADADRRDQRALENQLAAAEHEIAPLKKRKAKK